MQILVRWEGIDPETDAAWEDSWQPWGNCDGVSQLRNALMRGLEQRRKRDAEREQASERREEGKGSSGSRHTLGAAKAAPKVVAAKPTRRAPPRGVKAAERIGWEREVDDEGEKSGSRKESVVASVGDILSHDIMGGAYTLLGGAHPLKD